MWAPAKFPILGKRVTVAAGGVTVLLLHMDGSDGSTTFTDSSASAHTITANGNAQIDTAQSVFGGASALLDGAGDYLLADGSSEFAFGTGDFTIDFRLRLQFPGITTILYDCRNASEGVYPTIYTLSGKVVWYTNSADRITGTTTTSADTWYHVAVTRSGTSTKLFINGTQEGSTYTDSNNYLVGSSRPVLGISGVNLTGAPLPGWIDELRVLKGEAAWTANFTPPASAYTS